jgi:hypothetical protein
MSGLHHFKVRSKLTPRFIVPLKILEKRGEVSYQLELSPQLSDVHDAFISLHILLRDEVIWYFNLCK